MGVLHERCVSALREYMAQAVKTCNMLRNFTDKSPSTTELKGITVQRSRENEAHRKYMELRERLLEAAQRAYQAKLKTFASKGLSMHPYIKVSPGS